MQPLRRSAKVQFLRDDDEVPEVAEFHLSGMMVGEMDEFQAKDGMIRLGQLLKASGLVSTGGEAKMLLADGQVRVNGEVDTRRGRQLHPGDVVTLAGESVRLT